MSNIAVRVEDLGKRYRVGSRAAYGSLRESLATGLQAPIRALRSRSGVQPPRTLWALRDVGFEIGWGEVLGVIGRNGAGKTTLLKILSRVTYPTTGHAELHGRVASLLEAGTGFHAELT